MNGSLTPAQLAKNRLYGVDVTSVDIGIIGTLGQTLAGLCLRGPRRDPGYSRAHIYVKYRSNKHFIYLATKR